jgi:hypothetical protein
MGRPANPTQAAIIDLCLVDALRRERVPNFLLAVQLRDALAPLRVNSQQTDFIIGRFIGIGKTARGPDDLGLAARPVAPKVSK